MDKIFCLMYFRQKILVKIGWEGGIINKMCINEMKAYKGNADIEKLT